MNEDKSPPLLHATADEAPTNVELVAAQSICSRSVASFAALIYLGFLTLLYSFQTRMIFPGASTQGQPFAQVRNGADTELVNLTTSAGERCDRPVRTGHDVRRPGRPGAAHRARP